MTKTKLDRDRNPILGEFFTTESVEERADSIVRESIQNSLDAAITLETKVHVRFAFGVADFNGNNFGEGLWEHVSAADTGGYLKGLGEQKESRFLVVEDFGTTGLREIQRIMSRRMTKVIRRKKTSSITSYMLKVNHVSPERIGVVGALENTPSLMLVARTLCLFIRLEAEARVKVEMGPW